MDTSEFQQFEIERNDLFTSVRRATEEMENKDVAKHNILILLTEVEMLLDEESSKGKKLCMSRLEEAEKLSDEAANSTLSSYIRQLIDHLLKKPIEKIPKIVVIGETGCGKSTLCNVFMEGRNTQDKLFPTSFGADSCTSTVKILKGKWLGYDKEMVVVDCPGFNDSFDRDIVHLDGLIRDLKKLGYISGFILILNSTQCRLTRAHYDMIDIFRGVFGITLFDNMLIVLTHWALDPLSQQRRALSNDTKSARISKLNEKLKDRYKLSEEIPCFFLDSVEYKNGNDDDKHVETLNNIFSSLNTLEPYHTINIDNLRLKNKKINQQLSEVPKLLETIKSHTSSMPETPEMKEINNTCSDLHLGVVRMQIEALEHEQFNQTNSEEMGFVRESVNYQEENSENFYKWSKISPILRKIVHVLSVVGAFIPQVNVVSKVVGAGYIIAECVMSFINFWF